MARLLRPPADGSRVLDLEKILAYEGGITLRKVVIRKKGAGWMLVIAVSRGQSALVCFYDAHSVAGCWDTFFSFWDQNAVRWHRDKFHNVAP